MTNEELIAIYNPANAASLTPEQITAMQSLDNAQICALAKAYPNRPRGNAYLVLYDTDLPQNKQLFSLSTWQNLCNLRSKMSKKNFVPFTFRNLFVQTTGSVARSSNSQPATKQVVDISTAEVATALSQAAATNTGNKGVVEQPVRTANPALTSVPGGQAAAAKPATKPAASIKPSAAAAKTAAPNGPKSAAAIQQPVQQAAQVDAGVDDIPVVSPDDAVKDLNIPQGGGQNNTAE